MCNSPSVKALIRQYQPQLVETVRQSVRIPSVLDAEAPGAPYGPQINVALEHALETARSLGFKTGNVDSQIGWCEYGAGEEMVAVLGHLDVVPAGTGWRHESFGAELSEGRIWGRGTMDDKGPLFACLYGLKALADAGIPLRRRIRILFGTNEESGSADIPHYTAREELPVLAFSPDGEFPVIFAEKGILNFKISAAAESGQAPVQLESLHGGTAPNAVPDVCTARLRTSDSTIPAALRRECELRGFRHELSSGADGSIELSLFGKSAHGSTPEKGINAAARMLLILDTLSLENGIARAVHFLAEKIGQETDGQSLGLAMRDSIGALSLNLGLLDYENGELSAALNIRFPVTKCAGDITEPLTRLAAENGLECQLVSRDDPLYYKPEEPLVAKLLEVYHDYRPGGEPIAIGGGTYAKELPNTVAFGPLFPGRPDFNHQAEEYITLEELEELTQIFAQAMATLANMDK